MTSIITTYRDTHAIDWSVHFRVEVFGEEERSINQALREKEKEIALRREANEKDLISQRSNLRWWQFFKRDVLNEQIADSKKSKWSDDWLVAIHFNDYLKEQGYRKVDKKISEDGRYCTVTIEKWEKT